MQGKKLFLSDVHPELEAEWHPTKNSIPFNKVTPQSRYNAWWLCSQGHEWQALVYSRANGSGCPYCSGRYAIKGVNDLATTNPELAKQWHPTKNGDLTPFNTKEQSNKKVWWLGKCGHEWQATVCSRAGGKECPYCSGRFAIKGVNDLATTNPELAKEWHPTKNRDLTPFDVKAHSNKKVWWICSQGHEWQTMISSRADGRGCPYCSGQAVLEGFNDLASQYPEIAKEWHPTKNGNLTPNRVTKGYDKAWWICEFGHEWEAPVYQRTAGHGCPTCAKAQRSSFAEQTIFFYVSKVFPDAINGDMRYGIELDVFIPSISVAIEYDGFKWHSDERTTRKDIQKNRDCLKNGVLLYRFREDGCPKIELNENTFLIRCKYQDNALLETAITEFFKIIKRDAPDINIERDRVEILEQYIAARKRKSLFECNPELAAEWHPTKNGSITPKSVNIGSAGKYWWLGKCGHEWQAAINNRATGKGCPFCNGNKVLTGFNDLATTNPELAAEWHPNKNGDLSPYDVREHSNKKAWWLGKCGHEWQANINSRARGNGCPYCSGQTVLEGFNDLQTVLPELAAEWHPTKNGDLLPTMFTKGSHKKVWWKCKNGHEWQAEIKSRAIGHGCHLCEIEERKKKNKKGEAK